MDTNFTRTKKRNSLTPLFVLCLMVAVLLMIAASDGTHILYIEQKII